MLGARRPRARGVHQPDAAPSRGKPHTSVAGAALRGAGAAAGGGSRTTAKAGASRRGGRVVGQVAGAPRGVCLVGGGQVAGESRSARPHRCWCTSDIHRTCTLVSLHGWHPASQHPTGMAMQRGTRQTCCIVKQARPACTHSAG
eukprot:363634-Chlamydomonas_euryale.AAC.4